MTVSSSYGQILNIESIRQKEQNKRWVGSVKLNVQLLENKNSFVLVTNRIRLQYKKDKVLVLGMNDYNLKTSNDKEIVKNGTQHIRLNYDLKSRLKLEAFGQNQFDEIRDLESRILLGVGLRYKLSKHEKYRVYTGLSIMQEWEKVKNEDRFDDLRLSTYVSFSFFFNEHVSLVNTTYFQPNLSDFSDYRVSTDMMLVLKIFKNLAFNTSLLWSYDAQPPVNIPKVLYKFTNGLVYTF
jgi:hypothetical protein